METWLVCLLALIISALAILCAVRIILRRRRRGRTAPEVRSAVPAGDESDLPRISYPSQSQRNQQHSRASSSSSNVRAGSSLKAKNVEAAMRMRQEMRDQEEMEMGLAMSRSMHEASAGRALQPTAAKPAHAGGAAAAAAASRAASAARQNAPLGAPPRPGRPQQLAPISPCRSGAKTPLPPVQPNRAASVHSAEFKAAVEAELNEWSTRQYANNSFLHEIGRTARSEQRDVIEARLEREWRAAGLPINDVAPSRAGGGAQPFAGTGRRLGDAGGTRPPRPRGLDLD